MASSSNPNRPNSIVKSNSKVRVYDKDDETQIDRISDLPDSILCHILSFLPTKDAAKTSFLSMRWGDIFWSSPISKLDFIDDQMDMVLFTEFVEEVLFKCVLMETALHTLRFSCTQTYEDRVVNGWINVAASLNVQSLDLKVRIPNPVWLGQSIGSCTCLTALRLVGYPLCIADSICLPNLKLLNLEHIAFYKEMTVANLFNGCPVLEELIMVDCGVFERKLEICIPTLKRLRMQGCSFQNIGDGFKAIGNYEIVLNIPALEELYYCDPNAASRYTVKELSCISVVHLDVKPSEEQEEEESTINFGLSVAEFVMACSNTKYLYLSERSMLAIEYSHGLLTLFPNLKKLEVGVLSPRKWGLLLHLLDCAPEVFSLCVELGLGEYDWFADFNPPLASSLPACFAKTFGKCSILNFSGADQEFSFVAYFLKHAKYLQKMVISYDSVVSMDYQSHIKENLLNMPRCSKACEVVFRTHVGENWS